jgi:hypothetical protein
LCFTRGLRPQYENKYLYSAIAKGPSIIHSQETCRKDCERALTLIREILWHRSLLFVEQEHYHAYEVSYIFPILLFHVCAFSNPLRPVRSRHQYEYSLSTCTRNSSELLTVHQCPLDFLLIRHDERTVLENSLIERLPSDLSPKNSGMALYEDRVHTRTNDVSSVVAVSRTPVSPSALERTRVWKASWTGPLSPTLTAPFKTRETSQPLIKPTYSANIL